jgi:hypothetical protein
MTIQIPEDLPALEAIAASCPTAPTTVIHDPPSPPGIEGPEIPVVRLDVDENSGYVQFFTYPDNSASSLIRGLAISDVVAQLRDFVKPGVERELFWVSGLRPLGDGHTLDDENIRVRLCLPLDRVATADEPERVAFVARTA